MSLTFKQKQSPNSIKSEASSKQLSKLPFKQPIKIASLFSGGGGLDLGFEKAGFQIVWANEYDKSIHATYKLNHPNTQLDTRSIVNVKSDKIPDVDGIIGGPPCQSWSAAGSNRGAQDSRGSVFFEYLRIIKDKQPKFFVIENVEGILRSTHQKALENIIEQMNQLGYQLNYQLLNAKDYQVPQDRQRVFFIGFRNDLLFPIDPISNRARKKPITKYQFPQKVTPITTLEQSIYDLRNQAIPNSTNLSTNPPNNRNFDHQYLNTDWSSQFMSRNRVRTWKQVSFTIPASGRHIPIHPNAPLMEKVSTDLFKFKEGQENRYRRFTIRECLRIQTFPDNYQLDVTNINHAYKIIGNAVPVNLAYHIANSIKSTLSELLN